MRCEVVKSNSAFTKWLDASYDVCVVPDPDCAEGCVGAPNVAENAKSCAKLVQLEVLSVPKLLTLLLKTNWPPA